MSESNNPISARRIGGMEENMAAVDGRAFIDAPLAKALVPLAARMPEIVGLTADLGRVTDMFPFRDAYPDRYFNVGMAEQNLFAVGAGLARAGKVAFCTTFGVFASRRAYDFIAICAAHSRLDVKVIAAKPGLTNSYGATHQPIEDTAMMRMIPGLGVIDPCDALEYMQVVEAIATTPGTFYVRALRGRVPVVLPESYRFRIGVAALLRTGSDVGILCSGLMTGKALSVADRLRADGIAVSVLHVPTIKPFPVEQVLDFAAAHPRLVVAENHLASGGLIGLVAETLCEHALPRRFAKVGLADQFFECGSEEYLEAKFGIDEAAVERAVRAVLEQPAGRISLRRGELS